MEKGQGAHGWLWRLRFGQAQAEIALACGDYQSALQQAGHVITASRQLGRVKYEVAGLQARGQALAALGRAHEAIVDLESAVERARKTSDPAMFLRAAAPSS